MLESCYRPLGRCFGFAGGGCGGCCGGGSGGDGLLWDMDLKPHASGDYSIAVVQANSSLEDQSQVFTSPSTTYVGVYDGHGGPEASRFITNHLFSYLHKFASDQGGLSADVIRKAFDATEEEFLHLVKRSWLAQPQIASVGSCCLVGVISNDILYVANLGDSRAVLGRAVSDGPASKSTNVVAERLSTDHNVGDEEVSRSIGDVYLKKPEFNRDPRFLQFGSPVPLKRAVVSAEPSILIRKLRPQDLFLIFASDGLWEQLSDEVAVEIVKKSSRVGIAKRLIRAALQEAAKKREMSYDDIKRIEKGVRRHFHDDITVIVIYLDRQQRSPNGKCKDYRMVDCTSAPVDIFTLNSDETESTPQTSP
ncbi:hypothetical protein CsSME_00005598 [Camellia sinensis var. sinensis]